MKWFKIIVILFCSCIALNINQNQPQYYCSNNACNMAWIIVQQAVLHKILHCTVVKIEHNPTIFDDLSYSAVAIDIVNITTVNLVVNLLKFSRTKPNSRKISYYDLILIAFLSVNVLNVFSVAYKIQRKYNKNKIYINIYVNHCGCYLYKYIRNK